MTVDYLKKYLDTLPTAYDNFKITLGKYNGVANGEPLFQPESYVQDIIVDTDEDEFILIKDGNNIQ